MAKTRFVWDMRRNRDSYLMEKDGAGATKAVFTNEPAPYGRLISQRRGGETRFYHYDGQHSVRALTDENGDVTDTATYTAFGKKVASTGTTVNPFGYKGALGYHTDSPTGDIYVRARVYQPSIARWLSLLYTRRGTLDGDLAPIHGAHETEATGLGGASVCRIHQSFQMCPIPIPDIPFPELPPEQPESDFPTGKCDIEFACSDFVWFTDLCPACACAETQSGKTGMTNQECAKKLQSQIDSIAKCADILVGNVTCKNECVPGLPGFGITCQRRVGDQLRLDICISTGGAQKLTKCILDPLTIHELKHVRQWIDHVCNNGPDPGDDIHRTEEEAYRAQCERLLRQLCTPANEFQRRVDECVRNFVTQSTDPANRRRFGQACRDLSR